MQKKWVIWGRCLFLKESGFVQVNVRAWYILPVKQRLGFVILQRTSYNATSVQGLEAVHIHWTWANKPWLEQNRIKVSALLKQMCLSAPVISTTHFSSAHTCPCPQRAPAVEHMVPYFTSTAEVLRQREEVSIEKRLRKKYLSMNTGNGMGHWAGGAGAVTGRRSIAFAKEAFPESGDVSVCRQWVQWLLNAMVISCNHSYQPYWE